MDTKVNNGDKQQPIDENGRYMPYGASDFKSTNDKRIGTIQTKNKTLTL